MTEMNVHVIQERLDKIEAEKRSSEEAHILEDELHQSVLQAIADGTCDDPPACAALALSSKGINFARWYA